MGWSVHINGHDLLALLGRGVLPLVVDVRRAEAYEAAAHVLPTAVWRPHHAVPDWDLDLTAGDRIVVYCAHGEQVSQSAATLLRSEGVEAQYLEGGIAAWVAAGGPVVGRAPLAGLTRRPSRWVTRERPKIDRIACPWLIRRFLDRDADICYVAADMVRPVAAEIDATPFDIPDVAFSHDGELCSFDAFIRRFDIRDPALDRLAVIVRGADTARLDLAPQCAGLLAVSLGLSATCADDREMLERGLAVYDALYGWLRLAEAETHAWTPAPAV